MIQVVEPLLWKQEGGPKFKLQSHQKKKKKKKEREKETAVSNHMQVNVQFCFRVHKKQNKI
jgi:hypothetical protein